MIDREVQTNMLPFSRGGGGLKNIRDVHSRMQITSGLLIFSSKGKEAWTFNHNPLATKETEKYQEFVAVIHFLSVF